MAAGVSVYQSSVSTVTSSDNAVIIPIVGRTRPIDILSVLSGLIDPKITYADNMGPRNFLVFFDSEESMAKIVAAQSINIGPDVCVPIFPYVRSHSKIFLRSVPPFIPDSVVEQSLLQFGKVMQITKSKVRFIHEQFKHIFSFSREATMQLIVSKDKVPRQKTVSFEGKEYVLNIDTAAQRCYKCNGINHYSKNCQRKASQGPVPINQQFQG